MPYNAPSRTSARSLAKRASTSAVSPRRSQYRAKPATKALLDVLDEEGGAFPWSEADGVACTLREAEDASPEDDGG